MPELPEVETTRRGIEPLIVGQPIKEFIIHHPRLRWPVNLEMQNKLKNQKVLSCQRRGKYLLFEFAHGVQMIHLGMSGSIRHAPIDSPRQTHDHAEWFFPSVRLVYNDPRRFGAILWHQHSSGPIETHPLLAHLGLEPFSSAFTPEALAKGLSGRRQAIKNALLSGRTVVGVGNIYASECLFLARIHPETPAGQLSKARIKRLHSAIVDTLSLALTAGGTTLKDYRNATGEAGAYFELHAQVYGKAGQPCPRCHRPIRRVVQNQRATYFCARCQRRTQAGSNP